MKWAEYKDECAAQGARAGVLCPAHFAASVAVEERYAIDIPAGEMLAELVRSQPQWRLVYLPPDKAANASNQETDEAPEET